MKHLDIGASLAKLISTVLLGSLLANGQQYSTPSSINIAQKEPASDPATAAKVALGKRLFFDTGLSGDGWISCASCHDPAHGFSDPRRVSVGVLGLRGKRHAPTLLGRGSGQSQFWDGRAFSLEEQVLQPILNPEEMGMSLETLLRRLDQVSTYRGLNRESLVDALASYVRTIRSENTNYDLFLAGWPAMMNDLELEGLRLFQNKARCYLCHSGKQFTDESFHNTGIAWNQSNETLVDEGRAAITGKSYHRGAFKTPTLREVARRGPYMHDGSLPTLEEVIDYYDRGGNQNPYLDENIVPLHLSPAEKKALLAFLRIGLSGSVVDGPVESGNASRN